MGILDFSLDVAFLLLWLPALSADVLYANYHFWYGHHFVVLFSFYQDNPCKMTLASTVITSLVVQRGLNFHYLICLRFIVKFFIFFRAFQVTVEHGVSNIACALRNMNNKRRKLSTKPCYSRFSMLFFHRE